MCFDLVDCWDDLGFAEKCFKSCSCEIGDAVARTLPVERSFSIAVYVVAGSIGARSKIPLSLSGNSFLFAPLKALVRVSIYQQTEGQYDLHRPMHQIQIHIIGSKVLQRLIQCLLDIFRRVIRVPQLSCNENVRTRNAALFDARSYFSFVSVDSRTIDVAVSCFQSILDGSFDFVGGCLPGSKADGWDLGACI